MRLERNRSSLNRMLKWTSFGSFGGFGDRWQYWVSDLLIFASLLRLFTSRGLWDPDTTSTIAEGIDQVPR